MKEYNSKIFHKNDKFFQKGLVITHSAEKKFSDLKKKEPSLLGLRIEIKKSGCAGFKYIMKKVFQITKNDQVYESNQTKIYVSADIVPIIDGIEIDYVKDGLNYFFKFNNPKAKNICGCGKSFNF